VRQISAKLTELEVNLEGQAAELRKNDLRTICDKATGGSRSAIAGALLALRQGMR
jgi:hypothetical protein